MYILFPPVNTLKKRNEYLADCFSFTVVYYLEKECKFMLGNLYKILVGLE